MYIFPDKLNLVSIGLHNGYKIQKPRQRLNYKAQKRARAHFPESSTSITASAECGQFKKKSENRVCVYTSSKMCIHKPQLYSRMGIDLSCGYEHDTTTSTTTTAAVTTYMQPLTLVLFFSLSHTLAVCVSLYGTAGEAIQILKRLSGSLSPPTTRELPCAAVVRIYMCVCVWPQVSLILCDDDSTFMYVEAADESIAFLLRIFFLCRRGMF